MNKMILLSPTSGTVSANVERVLATHGLAVHFAEDYLRLSSEACHNDYLAVVLQPFNPEHRNRQLELCAFLRSRHVFTPIVGLVEKGSVATANLLLRAGVDSCLYLPHDLCNLYSQVTALARREQWHIEGNIQLEQFVIDPYKRMVLHDRTPLPFQRREFDIFLYLAERRGKVITREVLHYGTRSRQADSQYNTVDVHVSKIRKKLADVGSNPSLIETVYGIGYRMA
jgi:two-component system alkaline phosphatase synthesis response regulator PhoP